MARSGDDRLPAGVRFGFVDEPEGDLSPFISWNHAWSVRLLEGVAELHPDGGPDILEMADYQAEGFAAAHARRGQDPRLRNTALVIRLHTSAEMCADLNEAPHDLHLQVLGGLERFPLRFADALLEPGGNCLERYAEFYGADSLAPALRSPLPMTTDLSPPSDVEAPSADGPLRLLYLNRLERRKGITELISAVRSLPDAELTLTIVGGDTASGPDGTSMRAHAEELAAGDPRIEFLDRIPHEEVPRAIAEHHVGGGADALGDVLVRRARGPRLQPTGDRDPGRRDRRRGPAGRVRLADRVRSADDLAATLREVLAGRDRLTEMIAEGLPRAAFDRDAQEEPALRAYLGGPANDAAGTTAGTAARRQQRASPRSWRARPEAATRIRRWRPSSAQCRQRCGPCSWWERQARFPGPGLALAHAHAVVATTGGGWGERVAWAEGLAHSSDELVLLMPAGAVLEPDFLPRAAAILASEPDLAWVTCIRGPAGDMPAHAPPGSYRLPLAEMDASPFGRPGAKDGAGIGYSRRGRRPGRSLEHLRPAGARRRARRGAAGAARGEPSAPGDAASARSALTGAPLDHAAAKAKQGRQPWDVEEQISELVHRAVARRLQGRLANIAS